MDSGAKIGSSFVVSIFLVDLDKIQTGQILILILITTTLETLVTVEHLWVELLIFRGAEPFTVCLSLLFRRYVELIVRDLVLCWPVMFSLGYGRRLGELPSRVAI